MGWKDAPEVSSQAWMAAPVVGEPRSMSVGEKLAGVGREFVQQTKDLAGGLVRGAGSIGATLMAPNDALERALYRSKGVDVGDLNAQRRQGITDATRMLGADPESMTYGAGKLLSEIGGTAGAGAGLAQAGSRVPALAGSNFLQALGSGGMSGGNVLTRMAGGATAGAASAGLIDPETAGLGAVTGAAIPGGMALASGLGGVAKHALGMTTGVGDKAITEAVRAGRAGGQAGADFTRNMRGASSMDEVLDVAKQNLAAMGDAKRQAYQQGMQGIKTDKTILDMAPIDKAVSDAAAAFTFKGQAKNPQVAKALQDVADDVAAWKGLNPSEYHTPEGLDALKQRVGAVLESLPFEAKSARQAVSGVYNSIKTEISKQAPTYSKVMGDYSTATETIREIEHALSLGSKGRAQADTAMRKLQSLMRNNVNTNYGYRDALAATLEQQGGQEIMPSLAGQSLSAWAPRGISRAGVGTGGGALALTGNLPAAAGLAAISSPRLVGEGAYLAGQAANPLMRLIDPLARNAPAIAANRNER